MHALRDLVLEYIKQRENSGLAFEMVTTAAEERKINKTLNSLQRFAFKFGINWAFG